MEKRLNQLITKAKKGRLSSIEDAELKRLHREKMEYKSIPNHWDINRFSQHRDFKPFKL